MVIKMSQFFAEIDTPMKMITKICCTLNQILAVWQFPLKFFCGMTIVAKNLVAV
jgi:hypothetical protein